jgi:hypothetical protein
MSNASKIAAIQADLAKLKEIQATELELVVKIESSVAELK